MDRRTLIVLACGVVALMLIVGFVGMVAGGLSSRSKALAQSELESFSKARKEVAEADEIIEEAFDDMPRVFASDTYQEKWPERIEAAKEAMTQAEAARKRVEELVDGNDDDTWPDIEKALKTMREARSAAVSSMEEMAREATHRVDFMRDRGGRVDKARDAWRKLDRARFTDLDAAIAKASADWPGKKTDLEQRLGGLKNLVTTGKERWARVSEVDKKLDAKESVEDDELNDLINGASFLVGAATQVEAARSEIPALCAQLYRSWDRVLADMEIKEGADVTFHHLYRRVEVEVKSVEDKEAKHDTEDTWKKVTESTYKKHEKLLGMAIARKPAGKYDHEVETVAQPAGFSYISDPSVSRRNAYGHWQRGADGRSYWAFYGQYAFLRTAFWGRGYDRPILYSNGYDSYRTSHRTGRTWYGSDARTPRYGSTGSITGSRFSNSKYKRSGGFTSTKYKKSGGSYKGSRYTARSSRSSRSSSGFRSSRSSGSRFGGGK